MYWAKRASNIIFSFILNYPSGIYLIPVNCCPVIPLIFKLANVNFEFVDIDPVTFCINEEYCTNLLKHSNQYKGLIYIRSYGFLTQKNDFFRSIHDINPDIKIIDDRCLCLPENVSITNEEADLIIYSTGYAKPIDYGIGGIGFFKKSFKTKSSNYEDKGFNIDLFIKSIINNIANLNTIPDGWIEDHLYEIDSFSYFETIKNDIELIRTKKQLNNEFYNANLKNYYSLPEGFQQWRYNIIVPNKEILLKKIFENGLFASSHYRPSNLLFDKDFYPVATELFNKIINLFNDKYASPEHIEKICSLLNKFV